MVTDPYEDDEDDPPTLQRRPSGSLPIQTPVSARFPSGVRAALAVPAAPDSASGFPDEEDTAVDREPLAVLRADDTAKELLDETAARLADTDGPLPADGERDTMTLPIDIATALQRASK